MVAHPSKRQRVTFDTAVKVRHMSSEDQEWEKDPGIIREEIRRAIQAYGQGDREAYDRIKALFSRESSSTSMSKGAVKNEDEDGESDRPSATTMRNHVLGLLANLALLDKNCNGLVHAVIESEWVGRDDVYVAYYIQFLGSLVAAHGGYLGYVLKMLVGLFGDVPASKGRLEGYAVVRRSEVQNRAHRALKYVVQLVPSASGALSPVISKKFPFEDESVRANVFYVQNILRVVGYAPELQVDVLALVTDKLVKLDVQVQVDLEDLEEDIDDEDVVEDMLQRPGIDEEEKDDDNESVDSLDSLDATAERMKLVKTNIEKVDLVIDLLFEYYDHIFSTASFPEQENTLDLLTSHFQSIILPTYRSRHSQFLLFHFSQKHPLLTERFAGCCMAIIFNKRNPAVTRQSAAAYLASFVSRGAHVPSHLVRDVFRGLGSHLSALRLEYESDCRGPDLRRYSSFYSMAQALMYIFCFRWRDLTTLAHDADDIDDEGNPISNPALDSELENLSPDDASFPYTIKEPLSTALSSRLNPLKICSPSIVREFARIASHLHFLYIHNLIATNTRITLSSYRNLANTADTYLNHPDREIRSRGGQLDAYFPFDPYQLPRSERWVRGDYVEWREVPGLGARGDDAAGDSESESESSEEEEDGDGEDVEERTATDSEDE